jgi:hypothetical protein
MQPHPEQQQRHADLGELLDYRLISVQAWLERT